LHLKNIYAEGELDEDATTEDFSVVRHEGGRQVRRSMKHYNLDAIISVGYRVNSKQGTQFRIWANKVLRSYLVEGYALNEAKLKQQSKRINELQKSLVLIQQAQQQSLGQEEAKGLLYVLTNYTQSFVLLNQYDSGYFPENGLHEPTPDIMTAQEALSAISRLRDELIEKREASSLFGTRQDDRLSGILTSIAQSFSGEYLYSSLEQQAAHLLYFIVKDHPFVDGNKRIAAFMFVWFLQRNNHHLKPNGELKINNNALVALTLLVAQSSPDQKAIMTELVINLIKDEPN
jgi:death-on-curing family protein